MWRRPRWTLQSVALSFFLSPLLVSFPLYEPLLLSVFLSSPVYAAVCTLPTSPCVLLPFLHFLLPLSRYLAVYRLYGRTNCLLVSPRLFVCLSVCSESLFHLVRVFWFVSVCSGVCTDGLPHRHRRQAEGGPVETLRRSLSSLSPSFFLPFLLSIYSPKKEGKKERRKEEKEEEREECFRKRLSLLLLFFLFSRLLFCFLVL